MILNVVVQRPKTCQYFTCQECTTQTREICGWCPSSCEGRGKCRSAQYEQGPPLFGTCPPICSQGLCMGWNMCKAAPDRSWEIGAIGAPTLFVLLVATYVLMMWARRMHGTIPIYTARLWHSAGRVVSRFYLAPRENASGLQIAYLILAVLIFVVITITDRNRASSLETFSLGEAASFILETDACTVNFLPVAGRSFKEPVELRMRVTTNGTLDGVFVVTDFCSDDQYVKVNNTRDAVTKYDGYSCVFEFEVPADPTHTVPILEIRNVGSKATIIRKASDSMVINFGANAFSVSGTVIDMEMINVKTRRFAVPMLEGGQILLSNATVQSVGVKTRDADVFISVSREQTMQLPFDVTYMHPANSVCFVSRDDSMYTHTDRCVRVCTNATSAANASYVCKPECKRTSFVRLIPFRRDLQPGLANIPVDLESETGQLYFSSIAHDRVPPQSGKKLVDAVYVYDGLAGLREMAISPVALRLLDDGFHSGSAARPVEDFFRLEVRGPGRPSGYFVWVSDTRYVVLSRWTLAMLSLGMLVPKEAVSNLPLRPGLCPHFDVGTDTASAFKAPPVNMIGGTRYVTARRHDTTTSTETAYTESESESESSLSDKFVYTETYSRIPQLNDRNYSNMKGTGSTRMDMYAMDMANNDGLKSNGRLLSDSDLGTSHVQAEAMFARHTARDRHRVTSEESASAMMDPMRGLDSDSEFGRQDEELMGVGSGVSGRRQMVAVPSPIGNTIYLRK